MAIWKQIQPDETMIWFQRPGTKIRHRRVEQRVIFPLKTTSLTTKAAFDDIAALTAIHRRSFDRGWSASEFQTLLADKLVECFVLRRSGFRIKDQVVGFVLARSVLDEAEILTIAIDPDFRKTGGGRDLMDELMRKLYGDRVAKLFLEVDASNKPALSLYQNLGFDKVGERKGYYHSDSDTASLALIMQVELTAGNRHQGNHRRAERHHRNDSE